MIKTSYRPSLVLCTCILIAILTAFNPASFLRCGVRKRLWITRQWEIASTLPVRCLTHSRAREDLSISHHSSVDGAGEQTGSGGQKVGRLETQRTPYYNPTRLSSQVWVSENTGGDITLSSFFLWGLRGRQTERWMELKQKAGNVCRMSSERYASFGQDKLNIKPSKRTVALSLLDSRTARGQKTHQRHEISNRTFSLWCCEPIM